MSIEHGGYSPEREVNSELESFKESWTRHDQEGLMDSVVAKIQRTGDGDLDAIRAEIKKLANQLVNCLDEEDEEKKVLEAYLGRKSKNSAENDGDDQDEEGDSDERDDWEMGSDEEF